MLEILSFAACVLLSLSFCYVAVAIMGVLRFGFKLKTSPKSPGLTPVTMLKPLCGMEPGLADNLRTFCNQDYKNFQIVLGVRDRDDPAIPVINGIIEEFPALDISLVINDR
ncbi:MAG: hypothetical protein HN478_23715, partial [Rhodospirillaceae bacterium]|nr:hypothetical protein [Rhodospirillaceae bacterium]